MAETALVGPNVTAAQRLVTILDRSGLRPRAALWAYTSDRDEWRLWIVPPAEIADKSDFYLRLAQIVPQHRQELAGMDLGNIQFVPDNHPAIRGLARRYSLKGISDARVSDNLLNGFFLPDAVIIRMDLPPPG